MDNIRSMKISDVPRVAEINVLGWRNAYRNIISDDFLFSKMMVHKSIERALNNFDDGKSESYVYDDGIIKGFLKMGFSEDNDEAGSFEVWALYVDPFMQRQGIGVAMMDFCEKTACKRGGYNKTR